MTDKQKWVDAKTLVDITKESRDTVQDTLLNGSPLELLIFAIILTIITAFLICLCFAMVHIMEMARMMLLEGQTVMGVFIFALIFVISIGCLLMLYIGWCQWRED